jgi:hypothetical protein
MWFCIYLPCQFFHQVKMLGNVVLSMPKQFHIFSFLGQET